MAEAMADLHILQGKRLLAALIDFEQSHVQGRTISGYMSDLNIFKRFIAERGLEDPYLSEISLQDTVAFYNKQAERVSSSTLRRRMCALRRFFDWAVEEGYAASNPAKRIKLPRAIEGERRCLSKQEADRLIQMAKYQSRWGARDRAILSMLYFTGLRVSELCALNTNSVRESLLYGKPGVRVTRGKGGKERKVPLTEEAFKEYKNWEAKRHLADPTCNALFLNKYGDRITTRSVFDIVKKYAKKAGLGDDVSPHTLRHTFATVLTKGRVPTRVIQDLMGHSSPGMTLSYCHYSDNEYVESVNMLE